jgi:hypothetical protein
MSSLMTLIAAFVGSFFGAYVALWMERKDGKWIADDPDEHQPTSKDRAP